MTAQIIYEGKLRTKARHNQSGIEIITDAPVDNNGKGEAFSPTDLVAASLGSCMLTIMGIKAEKLQINIDKTHVEVKKVMVSDPRRISELHVDIFFPNDFHGEIRQKLQEAATTCPVALSLHQDIKQIVKFNYGVLK